jgi:hypothetical protein
MSRKWSFGAVFLLGVSAVALLRLEPPAHAYVEAAHSLGQVVNLSTHVVLLRVTAVDRARNVLTFAKARDLHGWRTSR